MTQPWVCLVLAALSTQGIAQECDRDSDCPSKLPKLLQATELPIEIDQAALQRQYDALVGMTLESIEYSARGPVKSLAGNTGLVLPPDFGEREECAPADDVLALVGPILLARGNESLAMGREKGALANRHSRLLLQMVHGRPVISGLVGIEYDKSSYAVTRIAANFAPDRGLPREP